MPDRIRLIRDGAHDGPTNMARDEALLECVGAERSPATLRLYQWEPPTVSLGYFQAYADFEALEPPAGRLPVVRRQTGGGAILHDEELTYALVLPVSHRLARGATRLYEMAHDAIIQVLEEAGMSAWRGCRTDDSTPRSGPFFCFSRRHCLDVLAGQEKLAGSAQRRTRQGVLQHGSIMFGRRYAQQPTAAIREDGNLDCNPFATSWIGALATLGDLAFEPGTYTGDELELADALRVKYAGPDWTRRR
jgi:lipoate-protein ligase A